MFNIEFCVYVVLVGLDFRWVTPWSWNCGERLQPGRWFNRSANYPRPAFIVLCLQ